MCKRGCAGEKPRAFLGSHEQRGTKGPAPPAASRCISGRVGPRARPLSLAPSHRLTPAEDGETPARPPPVPRPGGLCSPSGVPPRDCVWSVPRKPGLKMRRALRGSRSPEPECPDRGPARGEPPRPSSARRREALPRRRFARAPQGALAAGQGGAWRGAHVVPTVLPSGPQRWLAPGTGARGERQRAARDLPARALGGNCGQERSGRSAGARTGFARTSSWG